MAEATIPISIEKVLHDSIATIAQRMFDEHGLQLLKVHIDWLDTSTVPVHLMRVSAVEIDSRTVAP